jgi:hypothetical protein
VEPARRDGLALALVDAPGIDDERARIVLVVLVAILDRQRALGVGDELEIGPLAEIVIADRELAGLDLVPEPDVRDDVARLLVVEVIDVLDRRVRLPRRRIGREHERARPDDVRLGRPEAVADAGLLEQAAQEREIGLRVLHAILELGECPHVELEQRLDLPFCEQVHRDLGDREVLEDTIVPAVREPPKHRYDPQEVCRQTIGLDIDLLREADDPGPRERARYLEGGAVADEGIEVEVRVGGARDDGDIKGVR